MLSFPNYRYAHVIPSPFYTTGSWQDQDSYFEKNYLFYSLLYTKHALFSEIMAALLKLKATE